MIILLKLSLTFAISGIFAILLNIPFMSPRYSMRMNYGDWGVCLGILLIIAALIGSLMAAVAGIWGL